MSIFNVLTLIGGLSLFLFGMALLGQALERRAGTKLKELLGRMTTNKFAGLLTGLGVTAIIQSSSATTVMVVGFVNSGLMTLRQAINVIFGANIGTTVTAWILSLTGIDSKNIVVSLLKPSSFTPILALIGICLYMVSKESKRKDTGMILLGFATLMFGMETMSGAVSSLRNVPAFQQLFIAFENPVLGALAGAVLTAIIQSSSASVGILQALSSTGAVTCGAAIPIIMGQNIGTCATALLSSVGTNKNARRAALVHLSFNVIGTAVLLIVFYVVKTVFEPIFLTQSASLLGIAIAHSVFNILCTILMFPCVGILEKLVCRMVPDSQNPEKFNELDERLLLSPSLALEQCRRVLDKMACNAVDALKKSMDCVIRYDNQSAPEIHTKVSETNRLEDSISTYLLKLTSKQVSEKESATITEYMKILDDYKHIARHAEHILTLAEEMKEKKIVFTGQAIAQYRKMTSAVEEILNLSYNSFSKNDYTSARKTEALHLIINQLRDILLTYHFIRLQKGICSIRAISVWAELLLILQRVSDHCSNVSWCVLNTFDNIKQ